MPRLSGPERRKKQKEIRDRRNKKSLEIQKPKDKDKDRDKTKKEPKYDKAQVAKKLGGALSDAGKKISAAQEKARTRTQAMKDSNWAKRNQKRKGYRF